ncbi:hypothetical protein BD626DRAFT_576117 [Schizophyllum amplum]|uniref:Uncharacterized protein n=1 Tax=Schizophyllum amplum TaxID=97359 RepID=A0A550BUA4_9AGAR|nr:hypothetical protein BD626DRAFT_576117 [Auriculariopsis ampla]
MERRADGKPWWQVMRDNVQARKNALSASNPSNGPPASAISAQEPMSNSEASMIPRTEPSSADIKQSTDLDAGSIDANGPNKIDDPVEATDPGIRNGESSDARTAGSEDTNSDASDFKDVIAGILLGLNDASADQTPWLHVESYDIKQFAAPPDPSGFFAELKELDRIKSDYVERQHRRLEEVRRQDAEYMASLEASGKALSGPSRARKFRATVKEATERHFAKTVAPPLGTEDTGAPIGKQKTRTPLLRKLFSRKVAPSTSLSVPVAAGTALPK